MTAPDEYQRVIAQHREDPAYPDTCICEASIPADDNDACGHYAAHVAQALAADPGVRAAVEREALERAAQAIEARRVHVHDFAMTDCVDGCGWLDYAAAQVRDLMDRKEGE